jgi:REP-associated tyrosine transposase
MRYKRSNTPGATYFFTVVTCERKRMLCHGENPHLLKKALETVKDRHPFTIDAIVLLPDHLHCLWTLPPGDDDFSNRWMSVKSAFTRTCNDPLQSAPGPSRIMKRERNIWQRRFWEHQIRNDEDRKRHIDYIHYNPVKHGLATSPLAWRFSSFHRYVKEGVYHPEWGAKERISFDKAIGRE